MTVFAVGFGLGAVVGALLVIIGLNLLLREAVRG
jgi:hypothetical protein